ncbi:alpha/beta hydrolase [Phenylobacterium sp. LjRoot225]|uniref:alpha/beta hydrolase n=1 Tax=Phenylobacterium sp. LjRoot225 TaxID=3342285 RepID=UPI003ECFB4F3
MTEPFVRPDVRAFLDMLKANPRPAMTAETIAAMRPMAPAGMAMLEPPVGDLAVTRDAVAPGPGGDIPIRMFDARASREPGPAVVFFHGGGFVIGNIDTHVSMCAEIARRLDLPVISVDYRLAPEHPWPAAQDDGEAATRWIAENGAVFDRTITSLVLCGDSAGANLTLVAGLALRDRPAAVPVVLLMALYPATDPGVSYPSDAAFGKGFGLDTTDMDFYFDVFKPQPGHWRSSPLAGEQAGMPPTLLVTAGLDPLRDQGRAYAAKTIAAGVPTTYREFAGTIHGFLGFRRVIPSAAQDFVVVLELAQAMIKEALAAPRA